MAPGTRPAVELAKALWADSLRAPGRLGPYKGRVEQLLVNTATYASGIRKLYAQYGMGNAAAALDLLESQLADYESWARQIVLPRARDDFRLPPEI